MKPSPALARVMAGELCSGCGLCAGISEGAVEMHTVPPGYARPRQIAPVDARVDGLIASACPGLKVARWDRADGQDRTRRDDAYWGPWMRCLTGYASDPEIRHHGSSGGFLSALAIHALRTGMADRVVHVGADPARPKRNVTLVSCTAEQVLAGAGSRYAPSSPLDDIESMLSEGGRAVFIGKPCDVSALRRLALHDARVDETFPFKLSFFCGGMPSHAGTDRIVKGMGLDPEQIVSFRYRGDGWPGLTRAVQADGQSGEMLYEESWGGHLSKEVQFRCKICPDAVGGVADIACADAWYGGESGYPQFEESDGRSLVMSRTRAGELLLDSALSAGAVAVETLPVSDIILMQPSQARRKRRVAARVAACRALLKPAPDMRGVDVLRAARREKVAGLLRDFIGTTRRIILGRR